MDETIRGQGLPFPQEVKLNTMQLSDKSRHACTPSLFYETSLSVTLILCTMSLAAHQAFYEIANQGIFTYMDMSSFVVLRASAIDNAFSFRSRCLARSQNNFFLFLN